MDRVNRYFLTQFLSIFASLFGTLFFILSIVFFVQISRITSVVEVSFAELGKLYMFILPKIFIFTIPIAFFVSLALMFSKLSRENEMIVLFTIGHSPKKIAKFFIIISSITSITLLFVSLMLIPLSIELNTNFIDYKKTRANFNIKPTEFGQKFSNWIIFMEKNEKDKSPQSFKNIVMYYLGDDAQRFVLAKEADIISKDLSLSLNDGRVYDLQQDKIHQISFEKMQVLTQNKYEIRSVNSAFKYWQDMKTNEKKAKNFIIYVLISIFPVLSTLLAFSFGVSISRYQKNMIYNYIFIVLFLYFSVVMIVSKLNVILAIFSTIALFSLASYYAFKYKITRKF